MRHFAATETQCYFYFVAVFQKLENITHFDAVIIGVSVRAELDLFDLNRLLFLTRFGFTFLQLVFILAEIHNLADRWVRVRRNLNQFETSFFGQCHGFRG